MGSGGQRQLSSPSEIVDFLDEMCSFFMSIGMSYKDYWEGENALPDFYFRAYKMKWEREMDDANVKAWLNGYYDFAAYSIALSNAFASKDDTPSQYFDKPQPLISHGGKPVEKSQEEIEKEQEIARLRVKIALDNFTRCVNNDILKIDKGGQ